jgi:hypothetical protein
MKSKFFDKEKQAKAIKWLEEKWKNDNRKCEVCGSTHWTLIDEIVSPVVFSNSRIMLGSNIYPHFMITCNKCGNSKTFNAIISGILPKSEGNDE